MGGSGAVGSRTQRREAGELEACRELQAVSPELGGAGDKYIDGHREGHWVSLWTEPPLFACPAPCFDSIQVTVLIGIQAH